MADALSSRIKEGPWKENKKNSYEFYIKYYVAKDDSVADYAQEYGDEVTWADDVKGDIINPILVSLCRITPIIPGWDTPAIVEIRGTTNLNAGSSYTSQGYSDKRILTFSDASIFINPDWLGVRKCQKFDNDLNSSLLQVDGTTDATPGTWIFKDRTADDNGDWNYDYSELHENDLTGLTNGQRINAIAKTLYSEIYTATYYSRRSVLKMESFVGCNGATGFPVKFRPSEYTAGVWRSMGEVRKQFKDEKGIEWVEITRKMKLAPVIDGVQVRWNVDMFGTWSW